MDLLTSSPHTSRCQKPQPRTGYFICRQLSIWPGCFLPKPSLPPDVFMVSCGPSAAVRFKRTVGLVGLGAFSQIHLSGQLGTPITAYRCSSPGSWVGGLASLCPSTQQLGHLLTPGDRAVHFQDSLLSAPANSPITHVIIKHLLSARS